MLSQRVSRLPTATAAARRLRLERGLVSIGVFPAATDGLGYSGGQPCCEEGMPVGMQRAT